jgi:ATP-dependent Lhr-like helicase
MAELDQRSVGNPEAWVGELVEARRAIAVMVAGEERFAAAEDAAKLRDALGVPVPPGLPVAFLDPVERPLDELVSRYARTHGPFRVVEAARRLGTPPDRVLESLRRLEAAQRVVQGEFRPGGVEREWVDDEVLRVLRRRSLAALRKEVEPVDAATLGRFLPGWHGVGDGRRGLDALVDAVGRVQGAAIPASVLESDVLLGRVEGYRSADLDALCAAGEVVWVGAGSIGSTDGRVALYLRDEIALLAPRPGDDDERPDGEVHEAIRAALGQRGALFWTDLVQAAGTADEGVVLGALWDLVWAGEVTNDTLAPLRAAIGGAARRRSSRGRPRPGRLTRLGPPAGAGRWSLVAPLLEPAPPPTQRAHARARAMLERYGVVTREAVLAEGVEGGFAGVYGVLKAMEESGSVRRGYFVAGLGAAQFALPGAVDRLRSERHEAVDDDLRPPAPPVVLAATDPANPYGATLPWPESSGRASRVAGAHVVLVDGEPAVFVERGGKRLVTFAAAQRTDAWVGALVSLVKEGRVSRLVVQQIDGEPSASSPLAPLLRAHGFAEGYRGLTLSAR